MTNWLTIDEATDMLGGRVSRSSLYRAARREQIPSLRIGRRILLSRAWFDNGPQRTTESLEVG
ncbi:helix-turn-helix domain-containing protein [Actinomycetota bacterium]